MGGQENILTILSDFSLLFYGRLVLSFFTVRKMDAGATQANERAYS